MSHAKVKQSPPPVDPYQGRSPEELARIALDAAHGRRSGPSLPTRFKPLENILEHGVSRVGAKEIREAVEFLQGELKRNGGKTWSEYKRLSRIPVAQRTPEQKAELEKLINSRQRNQDQLRFGKAFYEALVDRIGEQGEWKTLVKDTSYVLGDAAEIVFGIPFYLLITLLGGPPGSPRAADS